MMREHVLALLKRKKTIGPRRTLTVEAHLAKLGEQAPYFSITAEERNLRRRGDNQIEACGCMHEEILKHWPDLKPLVDIHLSDEHGVPMHAIANAVYWCGVGKYSDDKPEVLAGHLRVDLDTARQVRDRIQEADRNHRQAKYLAGLLSDEGVEEDMPDPKTVMEAIMNELRPRWQEEADQALKMIRAG